MYIPMFREKDEQFKVKQKKNYDCRHPVCELPSILDNQPVLVRTRDKITGERVISLGTTPRSYIVSTPAGQRHRNRSHLTIQPTDQHSVDLPIVEKWAAQPRGHIVAKFITGTSVISLQRLSYPNKGDVAWLTSCVLVDWCEPLCANYRSIGGALLYMYMFWIYMYMYACMCVLEECF